MPAAGLIGLIGLWSAVGVAGLLLSLILTNPAAVGPVGVTLWFVALFFTVAGLITLGLYFTKRRLWPEQPSRKRLAASWRQGMLMSGWGSVLLALSSLRQFSWRDGLLLLVLVALIELYVRARA